MSIDLRKNIEVKDNKPYRHVQAGKAWLVEAVLAQSRLNLVVSSKLHDGEAG